MPTACPVAGGGEVPFGGALAAEGVADVGGGGENDEHVDDIGMMISSTASMKI